jgi:putative ABC transport system permease protein
LLERAAQPGADLPPIAAPQISAVVVKAAEAADIARMAETIAAWGDVSVFTHQAQQDLVLRGPVEKARKQIGLFRVLLTIIAAIIMALILYTLTLDKIQSIARQIP